MQHDNTGQSNPCLVDLRQEEADRLEIVQVGAVCVAEAGGIDEVESDMF